MRTYLLATSNQGKIIEMRAAFEGLDIELLAPSDLPEPPAKPDETKDTFEGNAIEKGEYYFKETGIPCIADDSGVIVEALKQELGVHTRRWGAGSEASDEEWITYFLDRMKDEKDRSARFVCVLALVDESVVQTFEGACDGVITNEIEAGYLPGLPIAGCFKVNGSDKVFSALGVETKNMQSHRGKAVEKLKEFLQNNSRSDGS
jgi:XTP/dITP diphosphohydrolase